MRSLTAVAAAALVLLPAAPAWAAGGAPVAADDTMTIRNDSVEGLAYTVDALGNDSDPDGDALTYTGVAPAGTGTAFLQGGVLKYRPAFRFQGTDSFTYTVTDGQGNTASGTVTVTLWVDPDMPGNPSISIPVQGSATLTWTAAARAVQYRVYRNNVLVQTTSGLTWTDSALLDTATYDYAIAGVNGGGWEGSRQHLYREQRRLTPLNLAVTPIDDPTAVSLTWEASGQGSGPWLVYRDGAPIATTTSSAFQESGLVTGREYSYQVQLRDESPRPFDFGVAPHSLLTDPVRAIPAPLSSIARLFMERGAAQGALGAVTVPERAIPGGRQQDHVNGIVTQRDGDDAYAVTYDFATAYLDAGGPTGELGFPLEEQENGLRNYGAGQLFEGGSIWNSLYGTWVVYQLIEDGWAATGWEGGPLGYPVDELVELDGGFAQAFQDGAVYYSDDTGSHGVSGSIWDGFAALGYEDGRLGFPTTDEQCGLRDGGCSQQFEGGTVYATAATGAHAVSGAIRGLHGASGGVAGRLGYPTSEEYCGYRDGGCLQFFQGGSVYWSPATGAHFTLGAIRDTWGRQGWENGRLGYPTSDEYCGYRNGGCLQIFQGGSIYWSPATGAYFTLGAIRDTWGRQGWENGRLGYPTTDEICGLRGSGCVQLFQGGSIYWSPATGAHVVLGAIRDAYGAQGWENGRLGYPITDETFSRGTYLQRFQGGAITYTSTGRIAYR